MNKVGKRIGIGKVFNNSHLSFLIIDSVPILIALELDVCIYKVANAKMIKNQ